MMGVGQDRGGGSVIRQNLRGVTGGYH